MPTTANGTAYTVYSASVAGAGTVYWGVADAHAGDAEIPTILYAHGSGGAANQFATLSAWTGLRDWLMDNGWAWVEGTGGSTTSWGNAAARTAYENSYTHVDGVLDLGIVVPLGRSMGGVVATWLLTESTVIAPVAGGCIINSGVQDLLAFYDGTSTTVQGQMRTAYGGASDRAGFIAASASHEPLSRPASLWSAKKVIQLVGTADTTVPRALHGDAMRAHYAGQPLVDLLDVKTGGTHDQSTGSYTQVAPMVAFLLDVIGETPVPPEPEAFYEVIEAYLVGPADSLYPLTGPWG